MRWHKLSDYIKLAADTYFEETGSSELNAHWIAEFFQDYGLQDAYPSQSLINFANLVQKELTRNEEQAAKKTRLYLDKIIDLRAFTLSSAIVYSRHSIFYRINSYSQSYSHFKMYPCFFSQIA